MIKLETHCHVIGGSGCADADKNKLINYYNEKGYKAICVTTHFSQSSYESFFKGETHKEKIDYFFSLIDGMKKDCEKYGIKVFYGTEVSARAERYQEYMLYGFDRSFLYDNKPLYTFSQKELFDLAEKNGLFMYQTHPFRINVQTGDPKYMHGAEIFNGHFHHVNLNELAEKFCLDNNLIGISGTDFHHEGQPITAGIYIPENIETEKELTDFIRQGKFELIRDNITYLTKLKEVKEKK